MLEKINTQQKLSKKQYKQLLPQLRNRLLTLQKQSKTANMPVMIVFEGWDLAGKGDFISHLTQRLDPRGFKMHPIRPERTYEKKHPWLWRFWLRIPAQGEWAIFDRSWYGRVLVERMENLVPESQWSRAYRDIVDFENTLADDGYLIKKFFLHIDKKEQKKRLEHLSKDPLAAWRIQDKDWHRNEHYDEWVRAYEEMFERTDSEWGTWTIVEATNAHYARVKIFRAMINALEEHLDAITTPSTTEEA